MFSKLKKVKITINDGYHGTKEFNGIRGILFFALICIASFIVFNCISASLLGFIISLICFVTSSAGIGLLILLGLAIYFKKIDLSGIKTAISNKLKQMQNNCCDSSSSCNTNNKPKAKEKSIEDDGLSS